MVIVVSDEASTLGAVGELGTSSVVTTTYGCPVSEVSPTAFVAATANTYSLFGNSPVTEVVRSVIAVLPATSVYVAGLVLVFHVAGDTHVAFVSFVVSEHSVGPACRRR